MTKILFVHPDRKVVDIFHRHLKDYVAVHVASNGLSALRQLKLVRPKLVASEVDLALISGLSLLKFVRSHPEFCVVPFLCLSNHDEHVTEALNLGANEWINLRTQPTEKVVEKIHYHLKPIYV